MARVYPKEEEKKYKDFYRSFDCVITGEPAGPHECNGNPESLVFTNRLNLSESLHNGLRLRKTGKLGTRELFAGKRTALLPDALNEVAKKCFAAGNPHRAYACMRLGHSLHHYFLQDKYRNLSRETEFMARALFYLRKGLNSHPELCFELLGHHVNEELKRTHEEVSNAKKISKVARLRLVGELTYWLNDLGHARLAGPYLDWMLPRIRAARFILPSDASGYYRQCAHHAMFTGDKRRFEWCLKKAREVDDSLQNRMGIFTTTVPVGIYLGETRKLMHRFGDDLEFFVLSTCFGMERGLKSKDTGVTIPTALGVLKYAGIIHSLLETKLASELRQALSIQEKELGGMVAINNQFIQESLTKCFAENAHLGAGRDIQFLPTLEPQFAKTIEGLLSSLAV